MKDRTGIRLTGLLLVLTACGGGYGTDPGAYSNPGGTNPGGTTSPNTVMLQTDNSFSPTTLNVTAGATVTWKWTACDGSGYSACPTHNVTFDDGSNVASATQDKGDFNRTFTAAGTYKYHCTIHGSGMSGQVVVK